MTGSLRDLAQQWLAADPDPQTQDEIQVLLAGPEEDLEQRFNGRLAFGTAGLRGPLAAGPQGMNRVLVRMTAAAIGQRLLEEHADPLVVIGYDARHKSEVFALDSARVLAALGIRSCLLPEALPTPVVAFSVRHLKAEAGIMVTASHNPCQDNGYKVYWADGAQINTPIDAEISAHLDALAPGIALANEGHALITQDSGALSAAYVAYAAGGVASHSAKDLSVVYTPVHGVGRVTLEAAFASAGFAAPMVVAQQADPDPDFSTVEFPNPEVPGTLDLALALAQDEQADLLLANDPDADRLIAGVPQDSGWRVFTGNEIGALLADHVLSKGQGADRLVATTVVSSRLLAAIAAHHGVHYAETLTGFKWIVRPGLANPDLRFVFGYEEALGFAIGDQVRDKDGITAALVFAEMASQAADHGRTVVDLLHALWERHGVHRTGQVTRRFSGHEGEEIMAGLLQTVRSGPPITLANRPITELVDYATGVNGLAPTNAVALTMEGARLVIRPSGTEPLLKIYGEVIEPVAAGKAKSAEASADQALSALLSAASGLLSGESPDERPDC